MSNNLNKMAYAKKMIIFLLVFIALCQITYLMQWDQYTLHGVCLFIVGCTFLAFWQWLLLAIIIGLHYGFTHFIYTDPTYLVDSSLEVKNIAVIGYVILFFMLGLLCSFLYIEFAHQKLILLCLYGVLTMSSFMLLEYLYIVVLLDYNVIASFLTKYSVGLIEVVVLLSLFWYLFLSGRQKLAIT